MAETTTYNGWTNYETWSVALILGNDAESQDHWRGVARECWDEAEADWTFTRLERAEIDLAYRLKDEIEENNPLADNPGLYSQLLYGTISAVNWGEIAKNWMEGVEKD